jgi:uncharacterized membrane protein YfcA
MHLSLAEYVVVLCATGVGATVQGVVGFGANLIAVPVVALFAPEALPVVLILWAMPLVVAMAIREHRGVDWSGVGWMTVGRLPGTALGTWVVATVATDTLSVLCGIAVLAAVAMSAWATTVPLNPATKTAVGFTAGLMGTATSIGGPPMALLYQHHTGRVLRPTLAVAFTLGTSISLFALAVAGAIEGWHVWLAIALLPSLAGGLLTSRLLIGRLDRRWLRPAVLGFATVAALVAAARGLA